MTIDEFADIINKNIIITRYANQSNRFCVRFEGCEVSHNTPFLLGASGNGKSVGEAMKDYIEKIKGQKLIFNSYRDDRQEFFCPEDITL